MDDQPDAEVREAMARFGAGEITAEQAADLVRPALDYARAERRKRTWESNMIDPDDASTPTAFMGVALARHLGVITMAQYDALGDVLAGA